MLFGLAGLPPTGELHGDMTQAARLESLERFRKVGGAGICARCTSSLLCASSQGGHFCRRPCLLLFLPFGVVRVVLRSSEFQAAILACSWRTL